MDDSKPSPSPFQFGVKLVATCTSPKVDATLYRQLVGRPLCLTHNRPDISFFVGLVAQYMQSAHEIQWKVANMILQCVWGILKFEIYCNSGRTPLLVGFIDSD
jgi:hypothetical protein